MTEQSRRERSTLIDHIRFGPLAGALVLAAIVVGAVVMLAPENTAAPARVLGVTIPSASGAPERAAAIAPADVPPAEDGPSPGAAPVEPTPPHVDVRTDGTTIFVDLVGSCDAANGTGSMEVSGDVSGMWSTSVLCLQRDVDLHVTMPIASDSSPSCWRDTVARVSITGTANIDGEWTVPVTGRTWPCPGEFEQWDWQNSRPLIHQ
ncbi:MAG TPA: hypothetical protein VK139_05550 [Microbacteriaceae bacterium]|nr:hypothetical protein [Microbacteriaceae bacterium]